jgi:hypothetical protein
MMLDETRKGWMAGILDFQGHVVRKSNGQRAKGSQQVVIYVETASHPIVARLCELTGGNPEFKEQAPLREEWLRRGCTEHCPEAHVHHRPVGMPEMARWTATGAAAAIILWNLQDYMVTEDEPWQWALSRCLGQVRLTGQGSGAVLAAARRLQSLGWELPPVMRDAIPAVEAVAS